MSKTVYAITKACDL